MKFICGTQVYSFVPKPNKKYIKNINNKYLLSILTVSTLLLFNEKKQLLF